MRPKPRLRERSPPDPTKSLDQQGSLTPTRMEKLSFYARAATASLACPAIPKRSGNPPCVLTQPHCNGSPMPRHTNPNRRTRFLESLTCSQELLSAVIPTRTTRQVL